VSAEKNHRPEWKTHLEAETGNKLALCYQCGKCTAGCPMAEFYDVQPNEMIRMLQSGDIESALKSRSIWLCASCKTCETRCPQGYSVARTMDALRSQAIKRDDITTEKNTQIFHREFLALIRRYGRLSEPWLVAFYKLGSMKLFDDVLLGLDMGIKGKLNPIPEKIHGHEEIKRIFEKCGM
jgi:heterodisulfide reductase subunit C